MLPNNWMRFPRPTRLRRSPCICRRWNRRSSSYVDDDRNTQGAGHAVPSADLRDGVAEDVPHGVFNRNAAVSGDALARTHLEIRGPKLDIKVPVDAAQHLVHLGGRRHVRLDAGAGVAIADAADVERPGQLRLGVVPGLPLGVDLAPPVAFVLRAGMTRLAGSVRPAVVVPLEVEETPPDMGHQEVRQGPRRPAVGVGPWVVAWQCFEGHDAALLLDVLRVVAGEAEAVAEQGHDPLDAGQHVLLVHVVW